MGAAEYAKTGVPGLYKREVIPGRVTYRVRIQGADNRQVNATFKSRAEALDFLRRSRAQVADGSFVPPSRITLDELWARFLRSANLRPSTRELYEGQYRRYIAGALGARKLSSITKATVTAFLSELRDDGRGTATIAQVHGILHAVLAYGVGTDQLARNPASLPRNSVTQPQRREPRFLSEEEVGRIAAEVPGRFRALVWTLALTGLRIGEATALRSRDLDLAAGVIRVRANSPEVGGRKVEGEAKTESGRRTVPIADALVPVLRDHLAVYGTPLDPDGYVFTTSDGAQVRQGNFRSRIFKPAADRAGISPCPTVHELRHTAASLFARAGLSLFEAARVLGHSTSSMTEKYTHLSWSDGEPVRAKLAGLGTSITAS